MKNENILLMTDVYKTGHEMFYPEDTKKIYSYMTTRSDKKFLRVKFFGLQAILKKYFTKKILDSDVDEFIEIYTKVLGKPPTAPMTRKLRGLVKLGYLPLKIKALKEGSLVPPNNCLLTMENTDPDFGFLVGFFESLLLKVWNTSTVATNSLTYKKVAEEYAEKTCDNYLHIPFAVHDFGYRGVSSEETAELSGMGHLTNFEGTDTIPAVWAMNKYYGLNKGLSVPATEHSTMATNILWVMDKLKKGEKYLGYDMQCEDFKIFFEKDLRLFAEALVFKNIITNIHPTGIVSIVSDTYDYYGVLHRVALWLRDDIEAREGKVVFRPDSGDQKTIIMDSLYTLCQTFGHHTNSKGFELLNEKVGLIYGDGMYLEKYKDVLSEMAKKKYASSNLVIGVGGILLQSHSRDDLGFAFKCTNAMVGDKDLDIFKDPKTDSSKSSLCGRMIVTKKDNLFVTHDRILETNTDLECGNELETVFLDGKIISREII